METVHDLDAAIDSGETAETIAAELSQSIVLFLVRRYAADRLRRRTRHEIERDVVDQNVANVVEEIEELQDQREGQGECEHSPIATANQCNQPDHHQDQTNPLQRDEMRYLD